MKLLAVKSLKYNTRRLLPGDEFEVEKPRDARLLLATKRVRKVEAAPSVDLPTPVPTPVVEAATPAPEDLAAIRAEYEAAVGRKPFHGWNAETLREKIAAHKADDQS